MSSVFLRLCSLTCIGIAISNAIVLWSNSAGAQITPDGTLPNNSNIHVDGNTLNITGGTTTGANLFHSFHQFSIPAGSTGYFNNALGIQNIISRVTGGSISNIDGLIRANGTANLFLINPNGIIFGPNASLNIGGSFLASTASSLNFADGSKFNATNPQITPLLTVSVPIGLQFGATAAPIHVQSQASPDGATNDFSEPVGLQVLSGKTLALVGGDVTLDGGNLTADGGRIELGSVAGNSLVSLNPNNQGWGLGYESVESFQKIQLRQRTVNGYDIPSELRSRSRDDRGSIQVRGKSVELFGPGVLLLAVTRGVKDGGDIAITAEKLIVRDGAQISTDSSGEGAGGNLTVNASESVELIGAYSLSNGLIIPSLLSSTSIAERGGDIIINTGKLRVQNGAMVSTYSSGAFQSSSSPTSSWTFIPGTAKGGNLTVNASESVELIGTSVNGITTSGLFAGNSGFGDGGKVTIATGKLIVQDRAVINVDSTVPKDSIFFGDALNLGKAGDINITARSILLDKQGELTAKSDVGKGGNIQLQVKDLLFLRRNSSISAISGAIATNGLDGNVNIDTKFLVSSLSDNSDILANSFRQTLGSNIQVNAIGIFGIEFRDEPTFKSDIVATGQVTLNTPNTDPTKGILELSTNLVDASRQLDTRCYPNSKHRASSFIITGRGGLPPNPKEFLRSNAVYVPWVTLDADADADAQRLAAGIDGRDAKREISRVSKLQNGKDVAHGENEIVEAQGWVVDKKGDVTLVAQAPAATPHSSAFNRASCSASQFTEKTSFHILLDRYSSN